MADWALIPSVVYLQPQPSQFCDNVSIFSKSLPHSKRYLRYIESHCFLGSKISLQQYRGQGGNQFFALALSQRSKTGGLLWRPSHYSQKIVSSDVLAFGDLGEEHSYARKHRFQPNVSCFASFSKEPYSFSSNFSGVSNDSIWNISNYKHLRVRRCSSRFQSFGALVDIGNAMTLEWMSAVDEVLLATTVVLAYMAGVFTPRPPISGKRKNSIPRLDNASADNALFSRLDREANQSNMDDAWSFVQQKLTAALDVIENDDSYGTSLLEHEHRGLSNILSLKAIEKGPRFRLLQITLVHLHKEIDKVPLNCKNLDRDEWKRLILDIFNVSIGPVYTRWLQAEQTLKDSVLSKELVNMMPDIFQRNNLILLSIKNSGKEDLYVDLLFILCFGSKRTGSCYSYSLLVKHSVHILEDLVIALADGIATLYLELISTDRSVSSEDEMTYLVEASYMSTRALERFRNEVALNRWLQDNFFSVVAIYEDRFNLWTLKYVSFGKSSVAKSYKHRWWRKVNYKRTLREELLKDIVVIPVLLRVKRTKELRALSGWRYYYSIFLEFSDIMGPLIRELMNKLGSGISFLLVSLIGRSLGLIYRGIRQSISWKP